MNEPTLTAIVETMRRELLVRLKPIEFDLNGDDATGEIELATDGWTVSLSGIPANPIAWVAIDAEPDSVHEYDNARRDAFRVNEIEALRAVDQALGGLLTRALIASQDPFSAHIAAVLSEE